MPSKSQAKQEWVGNVYFMTGKRWTPAVGVSVHGTSARAAVGRAVQEAKRRAKPHRIIEVRVSLIRQRNGNGA